eukprot:jgi/Mesvir1/1263/Mv09552-RA.1
MARYDETVWNVKQICDHKSSLVDSSSAAGVTKEIFKPGIREEFAKRPLFARDVANLALAPGQPGHKERLQETRAACPGDGTTNGKADIVEYNMAKTMLFSQYYVECEDIRLKEADLLSLC